MKIGFLSTCALGLAFTPGARADINLTLDQTDWTITAPVSGTSTLVISGEITLTDDWTCTEIWTLVPFNQDLSKSIVPTQDPAAWNWLANTPTTSNFVGPIFDYPITPTSVGLYNRSYYFNQLPELYVYGQAPGSSVMVPSSQPFEIDVQPAPEPASLVALAGLAAVTIRRRRR